VGVDDSRVRPRGRVGQRAGSDQLRYGVHPRGERVVASRPEPREQLPGSAPQQQDPVVQRAPEPELVPGDRLGAVPECPAAGRRAPGPVRVGHDPVQGDELNDDDAHDGCPFDRCSPVPTGGTGPAHRAWRKSPEEICSGRPNALNTPGSANTTLCTTWPPVMVKTWSVCSRCPPPGSGAYAASAGCPLAVSCRMPQPVPRVSNTRRMNR